MSVGPDGPTTDTGGGAMGSACLGIFYASELQTHVHHSGRGQACQGGRHVLALLFVSCRFAMLLISFHRACMCCNCVHLRANFAHASGAAAAPPLCMCGSPQALCGKEREPASQPCSLPPAGPITPCIHSSPLLHSPPSTHPLVARGITPDPIVGFCDALPPTPTTQENFVFVQVWNK